MHAIPAGPTHFPTPPLLLTDYWPHRNGIDVGDGFHPVRVPHSDLGDPQGTAEVRPAHDPWTDPLQCSTLYRTEDASGMLVTRSADFAQPLSHGDAGYTVTRLIR